MQLYIYILTEFYFNELKASCVMYSEPILLVTGYIAFCPDMSFFVTLGVKSINVLHVMHIYRQLASFPSLPIVFDVAAVYGYHLLCI